MNLLLTGGLGYIGGHSAISLSNSGHKVFLYDSLINSKIDSKDLISKILGKRIYFEAGDVLETNKLSNIIKEKKIDAVIHFAALKSPSESIQYPLKYYQNNISGTISIIEAMEKSGLNKLIFSSSASVYGTPKYNPVDEKHAVFPENPYAQSKYISELILRDLVKYKDWEVVILRYFNPIGCHESCNFGEFSSNKPNNLLPFLLRVGSGRLDSLEIFGNDFDTIDGTGVRDYIDIMDVADGHVKSLEYIFKENEYDKTKANVFNLGSGVGISVLEMINTFQEIIGRKINYKFVNRRPGDVGKCIANPSLAKEKLSWISSIPIEKSIENSWKFFCKANK